MMLTLLHLKPRKLYSCSPSVPCLQTEAEKQRLKVRVPVQQVKHRHQQSEPSNKATREHAWKVYAWTKTPQFNKEQSPFHDLLCHLSVEFWLLSLQSPLPSLDVGQEVECGSRCTVYRHEIKSGRVRTKAGKETCPVAV